MITIDQANTFLSHQLKFANWKEVIQRDKLEFLKLLVPYYAHNIYFQVTYNFLFESQRECETLSTINSFIIFVSVSMHRILHYRRFRKWIEKYPMKET